MICVKQNYAVFLEALFYNNILKNENSWKEEQQKKKKISKLC